MALKDKVANTERRELGFDFAVLQTEHKQQMIHTILRVVTTVLAADDTHHAPRGHYCI
jgi:2-keto-3-deoxy-L-rhamnonate aldolase RhmA